VQCPNQKYSITENKRLFSFGTLPAIVAVGPIKGSKKGDIK
jgi:hypothetical protein